MSFSNEMELAIKEAQEKHGILIDRSLFSSIVDKFRKMYPRLTFVEARRYALNECHVREKEKRVVYNSALGKYFGRHGGNKAASGGKKSRVSKKTKIFVELEENGQYKFVV